MNLKKDDPNLMSTSQNSKKLRRWKFLSKSKPVKTVEIRLKLIIFLKGVHSLGQIQIKF